MDNDMGKKGKRKKGRTSERVVEAGPEYYTIGDQRVYGAESRRDADEVLARVNLIRKAYYAVAGI